MAPTLSLVLRALSDKELETYEPDKRYWVLRDLLRSSSSESKKSDEATSDNLVVIRIEFRNETDEPLEFSFNNIGCKAELLNLEISDQSGVRIQPVRGIHIRTKPDASSRHVLPPKAKHQYDLVGEFVEGTLFFPGANYVIPPDRSIGIVFNYGGSISNRIHVRF